jgi:hypothetical protein
LWIICFRSIVVNDIVKFCKLSRLRWARHVKRQDDDLSKRVLLSEPGGKRPRGSIVGYRCAQNVHAPQQVTSYSLCITSFKSHFHNIIHKLN